MSIVEVLLIVGMLALAVIAALERQARRETDTRLNEHAFELYRRVDNIEYRLDPENLYKQDSGRYL